MLAGDLDDKDKRPAGHAAALELAYRQLRVGLEASKAAPAAADFYFGELEARRRARGRGRWTAGCSPSTGWWAATAFGPLHR